MGASKLNRAVVLGWNLWAVLGGDLIGRSPRCTAGSDEMTYTIMDICIHYWIMFRTWGIRDELYTEESLGSIKIQEKSLLPHFLSLLRQHPSIPYLFLYNEINTCSFMLLVKSQVLWRTRC